MDFNTLSESIFSTDERLDIKNKKLNAASFLDPIQKSFKIIYLTFGLLNKKNNEFDLENSPLYHSMFGRDINAFDIPGYQFHWETIGWVGKILSDDHIAKTQPPWFLGFLAFEDMISFPIS